MKEKACRNCRFVTEGKTCPSCGGTNLSSDWSGYFVVRDTENSNLSKRLEIKKPGKYALKVR